MERISIFDTTLRDGEQAAGGSLNVKEKIEVAKQLENLGVNVIEAGFPISSKGDFESVKATINHLGDAVTGFDERLWCNLLDHIVVNDEERVTVIFRDGMEIVVPLGDLVKSRTRTASRKKTTS